MPKNQQEDHQAKIDILNTLEFDVESSLRIILQNQYGFMMLKKRIQQTSPSDLEDVKRKIKTLRDSGFSDRELICLLIHENNFYNLSMAITNRQLFEKITFTPSNITNLLIEVGLLAKENFVTTLKKLEANTQELSSQELENLKNYLTTLRALQFSPKQIINVLSHPEEFAILQKMTINVEMMKMLDFTADRIMRVVLHYKNEFIFQPIEEHFKLLTQLQITAEHFIMLIAKKVDFVVFLKLIHEKFDKLNALGLHAEQVVELWDKLDTLQIPDHLQSHFEAVKNSKVKFKVEHITALITHLLAKIYDLGIKPEHIAILTLHDEAYQLLEIIVNDFALYSDLGFSIDQMVKLVANGTNFCAKMRAEIVIFNALEPTVELIQAAVSQAERYDIMNSNETSIKKPKDVLPVKPKAVLPVNIDSVYNIFDAIQLNNSLSTAPQQAPQSNNVHVHFRVSDEQLDRDQTFIEYQHNKFKKAAKKATPITTLNSLKLDIASYYYDYVIPQKFLCPITNQVMDDPVIDARNYLDCTLYFLHIIPKNYALKILFFNSYILAKKKLYYVNDHGNIELVKIDDFKLFTEKLLRYLNPFGKISSVKIKNFEDFEGQGNIINLDNNKQISLSIQQVIDLITSNGEHICYNNVMEKAAIKKALKRKRVNPYTNLPLTKQDLRLATVLKKQINKFVQKIENEAAKNNSGLFQKLNFNESESAELINNIPRQQLYSTSNVCNKISAYIRELSAQELADAQDNFAAFKRIGFKPNNLLYILSNHKNLRNIRTVKINAEQLTNLGFTADLIIQLISYHGDLLILQSIQNNFPLLYKRKITPQHFVLLIEKEINLTLFLTTISNQIDKINALDLTADQIIDLWEKIDELPVFDNLSNHLVAVNMIGLKLTLEKTIELLHLIKLLDTARITTEQVITLLLPEDDFQRLKIIVKNFYLFTSLGFSIEKIIDLIDHDVRDFDKIKAYAVAFKALGVTPEEIISMAAQKETYDRMNETLIESNNIIYCANNNPPPNQISVTDEMKRLKIELGNILANHPQLNAQTGLVNRLTSQLMWQLGNLLINQPQFDFGQLSKLITDVTKRLLRQLNLEPALTVELINQPQKIKELIARFMLHTSENSKEPLFFQQKKATDQRKETSNQSYFEQQDVTAINTVNTDKIETIGYDKPIPEKFLCTLTNQIIDDPVIDKHNDTGCTLYFLSDFQDKAMMATLTNSYFLDEKMLYYVNPHGDIELVKLDDIELFRKNLLCYLNPFGTLNLIRLEDFAYIENNDSALPGCHNQKVSLSKEQTINLITSNGGHTHYYNVMERAAIEKALEKNALNPLLKLPLKKEDLQPVPHLQAQLDEFVQKIEKLAVENSEEKLKMQL